jgi:hypothetical protein
MDDEASERFYKLGSPEFIAAFEKAAARWLSRDCHRSQYGYPFRVTIELALENRHRSVTLASFACSGADIAEGLFLERDPREGASEIPGGKVRAQLDQLSELLCRGPRSQSATYTFPNYTHGSAHISEQTVSKSWCPPPLRKRPIDVVLMSIGGNDVGFGALAAFALTESLGDLAPIAALAGHGSRFGPQLARAYLGVLDARMKAVKDALRDGFGVSPERVVQSSYEPIQYDETGALCGSQPALGMDVHPGLQINRQRLQETADSLRAACAARMHFNRQEQRQMSRRSRDRRGHRLSSRDGSHSRIRQAGPLRARPQTYVGRWDCDADAAQARKRRRLPTVLAGGDAALRAPLATVPHAKRRLPDGQHPSGGHPYH